MRARPSGEWFWPQWVLATAVGWAAGETVAFAVPEDNVAIGALHTAVIGALIGAVQWLVLRRWLAGAGWWVAASAAGMALGGGAAFAASFATGADVIQPWALAVLGAPLGIAQWLVLRRWLAGAGWWVPLNVLGLPVSFAAGLIVSFSLGFDWGPDVGTGFRLVSLAFFGVVAGALFGTMSGALLVGLRRRPAPGASGASASAAAAAASTS